MTTVNTQSESSGAAHEAPDRVLTTLNRDGSRNWLRPRVSRGRYLSARRWTAWGLIALFAIMPTLRIGGKPLLLFDIAQRQFTVLGTTFLPTDSFVMMLAMLSVFVAVFLGTALLGRVWCGWACPQTVYLEFVYRPIERWIDGTRGRGGKPGRPPGAVRTLFKIAIYGALSLVLAHVFLAYFVDLRDLSGWMLRSPVEHPGSFLVMAGTTAAMMFNFAYFREQTCLVACPYGRFQSVLLDRESLIIRYDTLRGEPRGRGTRRLDVLASAGASRGDCVDCDLCVSTCPTGIDIRNGLQMECVACAQCIDACDAVMERIGRPRGLIRYTSEAAAATKRGIRPFRGRVLAYGAALTAVLAALAARVAGSEPMDVEVLRGPGLPYVVMPSGEISNVLRLKITNRTHEARTYSVSLGEAAASGARIEGAVELTIQPAQSKDEAVVLVLPASALRGGPLDVPLRITANDGASTSRTHKALGPPDTGGTP
jgi:cytochrome c oxidase accessory protein FixG